MESRRIVVELPLPHPHVSPNSRFSRFEKASAIASMRREACALAKAARGACREVPERATLVWRVNLVSWTLHLRNRYKSRDALERSKAMLRRPEYRPTDDDNLRAALKAYQDGLLDAGLFAGDDRKRLTVEMVVVEDPETKPGVVAEVSW